MEAKEENHFTFILMSIILLIIIHCISLIINLKINQFTQVTVVSHAYIITM